DFSTVCLKNLGFEQRDFSHFDELFIVCRSPKLAHLCERVYFLTQLLVCVINESDGRVGMNALIGMRALRIQTGPRPKKENDEYQPVQQVSHGPPPRCPKSSN